MTSILLTAKEAAAMLKTTARTVTRVATENDIGFNMGGSAGYRFTQDEVGALGAALRRESAEQSA